MLAIWILLSYQGPITHLDTFQRICVTGTVESHVNTLFITGDDLSSEILGHSTFFIEHTVLFILFTRRENSLYVNGILVLVTEMFHAHRIFISIGLFTWTFFSIRTRMVIGIDSEPPGRGNQDLR